MKATWTFIKILSVFLALFMALYGGYFLLRRSDMTLPSLLLPASGSRMFMSMEGFRFTQSENGHVAWHMNARKAELFENKQARLKDLEITYLTADNKEASLIGDSGTMDTATGNASIRSESKEIRIVTDDGYVMTTSSLFWKPVERLVSTQDRFKLLGSEIYLEGKGLSANVDMHTIAVNSNVKAVLQE